MALGRGSGTIQTWNPAPLLSSQLNYNAYVKQSLLWLQLVCNYCWIVPEVILERLPKFKEAKENRFPLKVKKLCSKNRMILVGSCPFDHFHNKLPFKDRPKVNISAANRVCHLVQVIELRQVIHNERMSDN